MRIITPFKTIRIMKVNKDLVDAIMMVSTIILVLVGTTPFSSDVTKNALIGVLVFLVISMAITRYFGSKNQVPEN